MQKLKRIKLGPEGKKIGLLLLALVIVGMGLTAFGGMKAEFGPFAIRFEFSWGWPGESRLVIPPLGEIKAYTHQWPVVLSATLERIDLPLLQHELLGVSDSGAYLDGLLVELRDHLYWFLARYAWWAGAAGLFVVFFLATPFLLNWQDDERWGPVGFVHYGQGYGRFQTRKR